MGVLEFGVELDGQIVKHKASILGRSIVSLVEDFTLNIGRRLRVCRGFGTVDRRVKFGLSPAVRSHLEVRYRPYDRSLGALGSVVCLTV